MKSSFILSFLVCVILNSIGGDLRAQTRSIGGGALTLDDYHGHFVTITIPTMTGPGPYSWTLPITPGGSSLAPPLGTTLNSTLYWNGSSWVENTHFLATALGSLTASSISGLTTPLSALQGGTGVSTVNANLVFAGPTSGSAAAPSFRALDTNDIPTNSSGYIHNSVSIQPNANFNISGNGYLGGNIGIGTTAPITQLHIPGKVPTTYLASVSTGSSTGVTGLFVSGKYAYISNNNSSNLEIFDVSNPNAPTSVGAVNITGQPSAIYVTGRYAYTVSADNGSSLSIIDVKDPANPVVKGFANIGFNTLGGTTLFVSGKYAYVAGYDPGGSGHGILMVYDISSDSIPSSVGVFSLVDGTFFGSLYVSGSYVYVLGQDNLLYVIDVSFPTTPQLVGLVSAGAGTHPIGLYVSGSYAYTANSGNNTLGIFNISNPASPISVGSVSTGAGSNPQSTLVCGRYAYTANQGNNTLGIFDISNPTLPVSVGSVPTGGGSSPNSIYVSGRYAYLGDYSALTTIDLGGAYIQSLEVGSLEAGQLQVRNDLQVSGEISTRGGVTGNTGIFGTLYVGGSTLSTDGTGIGSQSSPLSLNGSTVDIEDATGMTINAHSTGATTVGNPVGAFAVYGSFVSFQDAGEMHINDTGTGPTYIGNSAGVILGGGPNPPLTFSMSNARITNLTDPVGAQDAATKNYVTNSVDASVNSKFTGTTGSLAIFSGTHTLGSGDLSGDVGTSGGTLTTIANTSAVGGHIIAALTANAGPLTNNTLGNAATVTTNASLTGPVTSVGNATTISATAAGNPIVTALNNAATTTNISNTAITLGTGSMTSTVTGTAVGLTIANSGTGNDITGSSWHVDHLGNVSALSFAGAGTGLTGTAAGLTVGNVTTNANLTGPVTSVGNATAISATAAGNPIVTALNNAATTTNLGTTINLSTTGTISTTGTGAITSAGALTASNTLILSSEDAVTNGTNAATVTGSKIFAAVTGTLTGTGTVTVTAVPVSGQVVYIYNNTTGGFNLTLGGASVIPGATDMFIYHGSVWIEMHP